MVVKLSSEIYGLPCFTAENHLDHQQRNKDANDPISYGDEINDFICVGISCTGRFGNK